MRTVASVRPRRPWEMRPQEPEIAVRLARELGLGPAAARVMAARGWHDVAEVRDFLTGGLATLHDPAGLPDMAVAVERVASAIRDGEHICVHGDYDVDGTTGSALLVRALRWLGATSVTHETPHRIRDGYGINTEAVERLAADGVRLIVTVDNGISAHEPLARARELGVDVIVTDHHRPGEANPPALAVINPWCADSSYPFRDLCGCAVAFKLAQGLAKHMGRAPEEAKPFLVSLLDFVALATIADVMPLRGENRAIVRYGLEQLTQSANLGVRALIAAAKIKGGVTSDKVGWILGPRINAAGRTSHAGMVVDLFTTDDPHHAEHIAQQLDRLNSERRKIEQQMLGEALEELERHRDDPVIVLVREGWHLGVLGIVASRILDRTERPVILLAIEGTMARGSARSIPGFDMHAALVVCAARLTKFGGHPMAAGMHCAADQVDAFRADLIAHAASLGPEALRPRAHAVDTDLQPDELVAGTLDDLRRLEPFGEGHPRPLFALRDLRLAATPQVLKDVHLKLRLTTPTGQRLTALAWRRADRLGELVPSPERIDLLGQPTINEWQGQRTVEFEVTDWQIPEP